jgi:hypothetical protein
MISSHDIVPREQQPTITTSHKPRRRASDAGLQSVRLTSYTTLGILSQYTEETELCDHRTIIIYQSSPVNPVVEIKTSFLILVKEYIHKYALGVGHMKFHEDNFTSPD